MQTNIVPFPPRSSQGLGESELQAALLQDCIEGRRRYSRPMIEAFARAAVLEGENFYHPDPLRREVARAFRLVAACCYRGTKIAQGGGGAPVSRGGYGATPAAR